MVIITSFCWLEVLCSCTASIFLLDLHIPLQWKNVQRGDKAYAQGHSSVTTCMQISTKAFSCLNLGIFMAEIHAFLSSRCIISHQLSHTHRRIISSDQVLGFASTLCCCPSWGSSTRHDVAHSDQPSSCLTVPLSVSLQGLRWPFRGQLLSSHRCESCLQEPTEMRIIALASCMCASQPEELEPSTAAALPKNPLSRKTESSMCPPASKWTLPDC